MTPEAWLTALVVCLILIGLLLELASPAVLVFSGVVVLLLLGVLEPSEAFSGFSNPAPFTVGALFVVARAVSQTGAIRPLSQGIMGTSGHTRRPLIRMLIPATAISAFMNNIPLVAMMVPEVFAWTRRRGSDVAPFLLPLSYGAILGGLLTVIGTSTNLVVAGQMVDADLEPFGFFEIGSVGLPIVVIGLAVLVVSAPRALFRARSAQSILEEGERQFFLDLEVIPTGSLDGVSVEQAGLRHLGGVFLVSIDRGDSVETPASPNSIIRGGNILRFVGRIDDVLDLQNKKGLRHAEQHHVEGLGEGGAEYFTVAIGNDGPLVGRNLREADFRARYSAAVVAIHRAGEMVAAKLGDVRLRPGDALVVLSDPGFGRRWSGRADFLLVSNIAARTQPIVPGRRQTIVILGAMIVVAATGLVPILHAALAASILMMVTGVLKPYEARRALDLEVLGVIASGFGLAAAVGKSGLGDVVADGLLEVFGGFGTHGVVFGVVLATVALTEVVTNNAAALLLFPVAVTAAPAAGIDPRGMAVAVAVAASASFLTPLGYQTNTMVYGPGGYRLSDYLKVGTPLTILVVAVLVLMIPLLYSTS